MIKSYTIISLFLTGFLLSCSVIIVKENGKGYLPKFKTNILPEDELVLLPINPKNIILNSSFYSESKIDEQFKEVFNISSDVDINQTMADLVSINIYKTLQKLIKPSKIKLVKLPSGFNYDSTFWHVTFQEKIVFPINSEGVKLQRPRIDAIQNNNIASRFVIVLGELEAKEGYKKTSVGGLTGGTASGSVKALELSTQYVIFDYKNNKPVTWGRVSVTGGWPFTKKILENAIAKIAKLIFKNSPFR